MATKISTELLIIILNNFQSTQDLYSSMLVNRIWCKVTIPILWNLPLGQECCTDYTKLEKKALCIRTYISCMDARTRNLLVQNGFDLSSSPPQATFDYPSFTHKFIINNLVYFVSIHSMYSRKIISPHQDDNGSRILFREMCKLIIERCIFLDSFKMTVIIFFSGNFQNYSDLIGSIFKLPSASKVFKKLENFTSTIGDYKLIYPFYESLKLICDTILTMDLKLNSYFQVQLLAKLIRVQKRLENLSIFTNYSLDCNSLLWAIISQKETLKGLRLYSVNFCQLKRKLSPIGQFISLQELYFDNCVGLRNSNCLFLASSFTQLSSFHYFHSRYSNDVHPQEFIIKIFETAGANLKNIFLDSHSSHSTIAFDTFSAILNYCTKITKLTLHNLSSEQVIAIFNNNFNELRRFSFDCGEKRFDANELLYKMGENVPESLESMEIRMNYYNPWIFSADYLRKFFEGWCYKGGGVNKLIIIKRTERGQLCGFTLSDEHFKVIEEYGVQFYIEK
ncbi:10676_t:CDS:1 [Diversispora eburnea]|uniref:10676_t:CDS:1 n=1 Tax=Diversispora eburnea TaxID=1213867 RepID=A0A9N9EYL9_9GLOM|nr:10676_t:CDS:1 [Diversispora eburnea]